MLRCSLFSLLVGHKMDAAEMPGEKGSPGGSGLLYVTNGPCTVPFELVMVIKKTRTQIRVMMLIRANWNHLEHLKILGPSETD